MKSAIMALIGQRVTARRNGRRLTQEQLANKADISRQALSAIERGEQAPKWQTLYELSHVLRCEVWDLLPTYNQARLLHERERLL